LENGQIGGAGFDVVTEEPPPADHPLMKLAGRPNFILTPHVAWASQEAIQSLADQLIENIEAFWSGDSVIQKTSLRRDRSRRPWANGA
jgi:glycerate dehydrogenase